MKKKCFLFVLCCTVFTLQAQKNFGLFIGGLEVGFDVHQLTGGLKPRLIPGLQLELALDRFAFAAGFGREIFHEYEYYLYTGQTRERLENQQLITYYLVDNRAFRPDYWTLPLQFKVYVHRCRCVYAQAGISFDFFDADTPDRLVFHNAESRQQPLTELRHDQLFKTRTRSYTFGIGFTLFSTSYLRFQARPAFVLSENPEIYTDAPERLPTFRMNFSAQFPLIRY
ncbi:MAG: hypothetical protein ABIQ93_10535 [Saprospiraceae bacterium]